MGNDNSRALFIFQHGKREEDGKDTWNRLEVPKHGLEQGNTVRDRQGHIYVYSLLPVNYGFLLVEFWYCTRIRMHRWFDEDIRLSFSERVTLGYESLWAV